MASRHPSRRTNRARSSLIETLDARVLLSAAVARTAASSLKAEVAEKWIADQYIPAVRSADVSAGYLSRPAKGDAKAIGLAYLRGQVVAAGLPASAVDGAIVTSSYSDDAADGGMTHTYLQQTVNGIPVLNALANVSVDARGRVVAAANNFVSIPKAVTTTPTFTITQALTSVSKQLGLSVSQGIQATLAKSAGVLASTRVLAPDLSTEAINATLAYVAGKKGTLSLVWHTILDVPGHQHWYELGVGAQAGDVLFATDYVENLVDGTYNVIALPAASLVDGTRSIVTDPSDPTASPFGWLDTNGVAGPEFTDTRGNNVSAQEDRDANNTGGTRPSGGASLNFDFPLDLTQAPTTTSNQSAAITNLFYLNNRIHDISYRYGFTEAAGNFQVNNYGKGGAGNDAVQADAQDGGGTNNANFATPADGSAPRMQMYLFSYTNPNRDGDLDAGVVLHEYTHGISNRLTGGPANASALNALQSGGMGEGWSDYVALMLTMKPTDTATTPRPTGQYVFGQDSTGGGIRRFPYSTDTAVDPETVNYFNGSDEVHNVGEIWTTTLWDMTWNLIGKYGKSNNIAAGYTADGTNGGDQIALKLVLDGMKLQPANPSLKDARDAILAADQSLNGGADKALIWAAFAKRGMGVSFVDASSSATTVTAGFDEPSVDPTIVTVPTIDAVSPVSSVTLNFSEAVNAGSFTVADDVLSFTGPDGTDLKSSITGFTFIDSKTLRIDFATLGTPGTYTLKVGPNITAIDNGNAMDQDHDATPGESTDSYSININLKPFNAADAGGYRVGPAAYDASLDLAIGGAGVIKVVDSADDASTAINLGTNSFTFYGVNYTGATSLYASSNGLITFGAANTAYYATPLTGSPVQPAIAVLWNDWTTAVSTTDAVLARFDDTNNDGISDRLVVEWNDVRAALATGNGVTFRVVLQLNTGSSNGSIVMSYPDLDAGNANLSNGNASGVGIKAAGVQGAARQLISLDQPNYRFVGQGKAVRFASDVEAPRVATESFAYETQQLIKLTFTESVDASLTSDDFTLVNTTTGTTIAASAYSLSHDATANSTSLLINGTLPDGNYTLTLNVAGIQDAAGLTLDGNSDFVEGGNHTFSFFVLAGDANHDRTVDFSDLVILAQSYGQTGKTFSQGNFDYSADGAVDFNDLVILAQHYNVSIPAMSSAVVASVSALDGSGATSRNGRSKDRGITLLAGSLA